MSFIICCIAALFIGVTSATIQQFPRAANSSSATVRILLGSSGNVYIADFFPNSATKFAWSLDKQIPGIPSWVAFAPPHQLYAVDEASSALRLFELDLQTDQLKLKREREASSGVVHLAFNEDQTRLVGSAYGEGTVDIWNIKDENLDLIKSIRSPVYMGPDMKPKATPHPHQANLDPSGRFFVINDLGANSIMLVDTQDDAFELVDNFHVQPSGYGPRHGVFYPRYADKATHYFVVCEISNQVLVYSTEYKENKLTLKQLQRISTFGIDAPPANKSSAAAGGIILSPDNQDLYISNRLTGNTTDFISHFKVNQNSYGSTMLAFAGTASTQGVLPRMISSSEKGDYIFVGNQKEGSGLVALKRNSDGTLDQTPAGATEMSLFGEERFGPQFVQQVG